MSRISFDEMYLSIAGLISQRSTDPFTKVGCVATNDRNELIGASYNGFAPKYEPFFDPAKNRELKNAIVFHAEQNIILRHQRGSINTLYLTHSCCRECAKLIAGHGVKRVVYSSEYHKEQDFKFILKEYGVSFSHQPIQKNY